MLWRYNKEAVALRIAFFTAGAPKQEARTVLVRDVPGACSASPCPHTLPTLRNNRLQRIMEWCHSGV